MVFRALVAPTQCTSAPISVTGTNSIRTTTPGPARVISEANADIIPDINTAAPPNTAANTGETTHKARDIPNSGREPAQLGGPRNFEGSSDMPNARPFGKGIRFLPKSTQSSEQYKDTSRQRRGSTLPHTIVSALQELDFPAEYVRPIPPGKEDPAACYRLGLMNQGQLKVFMGHRCQTFGHSSVNCHRPQRCVRCGEGHIAADCTRPRDQGPTCANCQGPHPASDRRCPVFEGGTSAGSKILPIPLSQTPEHQHQQQCRDPRRSGSPQWCPDDRPAHLSSSTDSDIGDTGPTNDRTPHTSTTERALVEVEPTVEGRRRRRRRKVRFPLLPSPEEWRTTRGYSPHEPPRRLRRRCEQCGPGQCPFERPDPAMFPPPIARPRVVPHTRDASDNLTSKRTRQYCQ
ncbi:Nucleic-acid-binding protein from transposon X-element [Eumeta japonica]|uniref:Nucleic-acid-binding protein from transposon X-element n=1 Tax=Eumeta variegata TaxID=151549 RepID=A0A4C2A963_EUMVA|nr:Nucleic-acid-binding protein from transposon X-element [Eumeta japonica]